MEDQKQNNKKEKKLTEFLLIAISVYFIIVINFIIMNFSQKMQR